MDWESTKLGLPAKPGKYLVTIKDKDGARIILEASFELGDEGDHIWAIAEGDSLYSIRIPLHSENVLAWKTFEVVEPYRGE